MRAISSLRASSASAMRSSSRPRSRGATLLHAGNALRRGLYGTVHVGGVAARNLGDRLPLCRIFHAQKRTGQLSTQAPSINIRAGRISVGVSAFGFGRCKRLFSYGHRCALPARISPSRIWSCFHGGKKSMYVVGYNDIGATVGTWQALVPSVLAVGSRLLRREERNMDTIELDPRLRHATGFLGQTAVDADRR